LEKVYIISVLEEEKQPSEDKRNGTMKIKRGGGERDIYAMLVTLKLH